MVSYNGEVWEALNLIILKEDKWSPSLFTLKLSGIVLNCEDQNNEIKKFDQKNLLDSIE